MLALVAEPVFAEQTQAIDDSTGPLGIRLVTEREAQRVQVRATGPTLVVPVHAGGRVSIRRGARSRTPSS